MAEQLTVEQKTAVTNRGGKLLVSAAAGSGKTKVLVDRLLSYILDPIDPANMDDFLIITYTKAAAAELRGKIAGKLTEKLAEQPQNRHLQQQLQRLHLTKISTVHSFCADILREYAYLLDIPVDFRVLDEDEAIELKARVMSQLLEEVYSQIHSDAELSAFVETQGFGRDDRRIPEIISKVYDSAFCHKDPMRWLQGCIDSYDKNCVDASETLWGKYLMDDLFRYLDLQIITLEQAMQRAQLADDMEKPALLLASTLDQMRALRACKRWDEVYDHKTIDFGRLIFSKKITDLDLAESIKTVRDNCKRGLASKLSCFTDKSERILADFENTLCPTKGLISLVRRFVENYRKLKRSVRVLDFSDLEHRTLDLLLGKQRSGPTKISEEIGARFREVMVDEYQDSNQVLDAIFGALTAKKQNCFMVGDVKQSIYQFRLADPSIFVGKYNHFVSADSAANGLGRKVILSKNFRSCGSVIKAVNDVFTTCMSPDVGGLHYGKEEALYEGVSHIPPHEPEIELYGLEVESDTYSEEAAFVAQRIRQLLDGTHMVRNGESFRPITPDDIVILLRSPGSVAFAYQHALECLGISCTSDASDDLLQTEEVQTLWSLLQTVNNPTQDIPLVATLSSRLFRFTADDLASLRAKHSGGSIYSALLASHSEKAKSFLQILTSLRKSAQTETVTRFIMQIFAVTRIDSIFAALPDGDIRAENLQSFCQMAFRFENNAPVGLNSFLDHLNHVAQRKVSVNSGSGTSGAVTIMSIHKSKGLEFPVVFLCALSRRFNQESLRAQVLCDKELGLGLSCVDTINRIHYPSIARNAIAAKMKTDMISEELRVLYVAMTRAKDRLIMVYSSPKVQDEFEELRTRITLSAPLLLTSTADCLGRWVLLTAALHNEPEWKIHFVKTPELSEQTPSDAVSYEQVSDVVVSRIKESLSFDYAYPYATTTPSKQTATQIKGREKDTEAAENAVQSVCYRSWRKPSFVNGGVAPTDRGNAMHIVMQYIRFEKCGSIDCVISEIERIKEQGFISQEQAEAVCAEQVAAFFETDIGNRLQKAANVLREFKFSILMEQVDIQSSDPADKILLQGVVDCALVTDDYIDIIDFKSDRLTEDSLDSAAVKYRNQLEIYAAALSKIYCRPVRNAWLYFFSLDKLVSVI